MIVYVSLNAATGRILDLFGTGEFAKSKGLSSKYLKGDFVRMKLLPIQRRRRKSGGSTTRQQRACNAPATRHPNA